MQTFLFCLYVLKEISVMILILVTTCSIVWSGYRVYNFVDANPDEFLGDE